MEPYFPKMIFDAHCDTPTVLAGDPSLDPGTRLATGHIDLPRMEEGGVGAQVFACWVDPDLDPDSWADSVFSMIGRVEKVAEDYPARIEIALTGKEIRRISGEGRIAAVIGVEGGHAIGKDLALLERLHGAGVRCFTLTWLNTNELGDSSGGERRWGGLSGLGRKAVAVLDRLGMVIDCSHASDETVFDVLEISGNPVILSHSCMRALCDIPRNASDEIVAAVGDRGGVTAINFFPGFLDPESHEKIMGLWSIYRKERKELCKIYHGDVHRADRELMPRYKPLLDEIELPGIEAVIDHIAHAVSVAGPGCVGLGSDFDGIAVVPKGLEDISKVPAIAVELDKRGFSRGDMDRVMGLNLLELFESVCL